MECLQNKLNNRNVTKSPSQVIKQKSFDDLLCDLKDRDILTAHFLQSSSIILKNGIYESFF